MRGFGRLGANWWLLYRLPDRVRVPFYWEYLAGPIHTDEFVGLWNGTVSLGPFLERYDVDLIVLNTGAYRNVPLLTAMG